MITAEKWWSIIETYGATIWPAQIISLIIATALMIYVFVKPGKNATRLMKVYLAFSFAWIGIGFFVILGRELAANYLSAALFTIAAILFARDIFREKMEFRLPQVRWQKYLTALLGVIILCYPLFSMAFGHHFPKLIVAGTFPCPTTSLALLLLTTALPNVDRIVYFLMLLWAIPFPIFIQIPKFGVYEDAIMLIVGLYSAMMLMKKWK